MGYAEGIALDAQGYLSEGSGENLFLVKKGALVTPPLVSSALPGITRDTVIALARRLGIEVREQMMPREMLYLADEIFLTGHGRRDHAHPVGGQDRDRPRRTRRPVTEALQKAFFDVVECRVPDEYGWLTFVPGMGAAAAGQAQRTSSAG